MGKALTYIFFIFFVLVGFNWLLMLVPRGFAMPAFPAQAGGLATIDFSFFGKNGSGRDYITQGYGTTPYSYLYNGHWHDGIDIAATYDASVHSASAGTVIATGNQDDYCYHLGFGKYVAIRDDTHNFILWYAHLGTIAVTVGKQILQGAEIGSVGRTGFETGAHLHLSIFDADGFQMQNRNGCGPDPTGKDLNPLLYLGTVYN